MNEDNVISINDIKKKKFGNQSTHCEISSDLFIDAQVAKQIILRDNKFSDDDVIIIFLNIKGVEGAIFAREFFNDIEHKRICNLWDDDFVTIISMRSGVVSIFTEIDPVLGNMFNGEIFVEAVSINEDYCLYSFKK